MTDEDGFLFASADERRRLGDEATRARRKAQADGLLVLVRLELDERIAEAEAELAKSEVAAARASGAPVTTPPPGGVLARVFGRAPRRPPESGDLLGVVAARREQLARLRNVDGPEMLRRASELARVLLGGVAEPRRAPAPDGIPTPDPEGGKWG